MNQDISQIRGIGKIIDTDLAYALAVVAMRLNENKYIKNSTQFNTSNAEVMLKVYYAQELITPKDLEEGQKIRRHFQHMIMRQIAGELHSFLQLALTVASKDNIVVAGKDWPLLAAMPSTYQSEIERMERRELIDSLEAVSTPYGAVGETVHSQFKVVSCAENKRYRNFAINAVIGPHLFFFFSLTPYPVGETVAFQARIKSHYNNKTTQLHYVTSDISRKALAISIDDVFHF